MLLSMKVDEQTSPCEARGCNIGSCAWTCGHCTAEVTLQAELCEAEACVPHLLRVRYLSHRDSRNIVYLPFSNSRTGWRAKKLNSQVQHDLQLQPRMVFSESRALGQSSMKEQRAGYGPAPPTTLLWLVTVWDSL